MIGINDTITLAVYIQECKDRLDKFKQVWEKSNSENPESFPYVLSAGEWDEQFASFLESLADDEE